MTERKQETDPCENCGANDCYWYGRTLEERKQRNNGQDPAVFNDDECEGYMDWDDIDPDEYTDTEVQEYMQQWGYEAALAKFECRVCKHGYPKCRHCEYWDGQDDIYED